MADDLTREALLPCPFCGGSAILHTRTGANEELLSAYVSCNNFRPDHCGAAVPPHAQNTESAAIAAWNHRAPAVPAGWRLVPTRPTKAMLEAGGQSVAHPSVYMSGVPSTAMRDAGRHYAAMLAAAPLPEPPDAG